MTFQTNVKRYAQQVDFLRKYKESMVETWPMLATEQDLANGP